MLSISPNPVNTSARIEYKLDRPANVTLSLQSILGENVMNLETGKSKDAGSYSVELDAGSLPLECIIAC